jgi:hypothetical protein
MDSAMADALDATIHLRERGDWRERGYVSFVPQFGLFLQCNDIPALATIDGGIMRRMKVVPFPFQFVDEPTKPHQKQKDINFKTKIMSSDLWRSEFMLMLLGTYDLIDQLCRIQSCQLGH